MKWFQSSRCLCLLAVVFMASCEDESSAPRRYYSVVETDLRGNLIATWISYGRVSHDIEGYHFMALEHRSFDPPSEVDYPNGRLVTVSAPNVEITRTFAPRPMLTTRTFSSK